MAFNPHWSVDITYTPRLKITVFAPWDEKPKIRRFSSPHPSQSLLKSQQCFQVDRYPRQGRHVTREVEASNVNA